MIRMSSIGHDYLYLYKEGRSFPIKIRKTYLGNSKLSNTGQTGAANYRVVRQVYQAKIFKNI
jgi:CRISPR/Cas system endoribonuclease Cas6 (RAMP superfamily)